MRVKENLTALRPFGRGHNASTREAAIAWTPRNQAVIGAIVGVRSAQQAEGVAGADDLELTPSDVAQIEGHLVRKAT